MVLAILISIVVINKFVYKSYLNPIFLQSLVWLVYYLFLIINIDTYDVYLKNINQFLIYQSLGFSLGGFIGCLFTRTLIINNKQSVTNDSITIASKNVLFFYPVVLLLLIGCIFYQIKSVGTFSLSEVTDIRNSLAEDDGKKAGIIGIIHLLITVFIVIYITTVSWTKNSLFKHLLLISLYIYFTLLLASKGQFVLFFSSSLYLLVWLNKISKFQIVVGVLVLTGIIFFLLYLGIGGAKVGFSEEAFTDILLIYTVTSLPALYLAQSSPSQYFGYYTFRVAYLWLNKLGFSFALAPVLSEFVFTPLPTNVYSYIKPYYHDFGLTGIFFIPLFLGFLHNILYFKARRGEFTYLIFSSFLIYPLVMQIFEENYFRQLSNWVYIFMLLVLLTKVKFYMKGLNENSSYNNKVTSV